MSAEASLSKADYASDLMRTILVVEDEEMIRLFMTEFLQDYGYRVEEAGNVQQARDILLDRSVDLVFSDINMPGTETGFALEKWVRRHCPQTKVLLTSGFPHQAADTRDLQEPLIPKPYNGLQVVKRIQTLLSAA